MKINGQEVDMKKVIQLTEKYDPEFKRRKNKNAKNTEWWYSSAGEIQREKNKERLIKYHTEKNIHRQKLKYELVDVDTNESFKLEGQQAVAEFLGYSRFNSNMRREKILTTKDRSKNYYIKEIL